MAIGIVMGVIMGVMMGTMFFGGHRDTHGKHDNSAKESAPVSVSSSTVQSSTATVHERTGTAEHPR